VVIRAVGLIFSAQADTAHYSQWALLVAGTFIIGLEARVLVADS